MNGIVFYREQYLFHHLSTLSINLVSLFLRHIHEWDRALSIFLLHNNVKIRLKIVEVC